MNPVSLSLIWFMWVVMKWVPISIILPIKKSDWSLKKTTHFRNDLDLSGRSWSFNHVWSDPIMAFKIVRHFQYDLFSWWKVSVTVNTNYSCTSFSCLSLTCACVSVTLTTDINPRIFTLHYIWTLIHFVVESDQKWGPNPTITQWTIAVVMW